MTREDLLDALSPLTQKISALDLSDPEAAQLQLNRDLPLDSLASLTERIRAAQQAGWLTPRRASDQVSFGRLAKASPQTHDLSIDAVQMEGPAQPHSHPLGEVSLCLAETGTPRFCGHPEGWVVVGPGSHHTPEVSGGQMLILYFLPQGAMSWDPAR